MALLSRIGQKTRLLLFVGVVCLAAVQAQSADEYQVKAAFLYNFAKFVEWPAGEFKSPSDPIVICVFGRGPLAPLLEKAVNGKKVDGRSLVIRQASDLHEAAACHLLFVSASEKKRLPALLELVKTSSVLTVGETANFTGSGGIINFKLDDGKVGLEINPYAAQRARLRISSKLLSLAKIVKDDNQ